MHKFTNDLIKESSPYLLQHAHNPVNWLAWSNEAFEKAKLENKLVLVSIGYSACHWCHVMEHESFENEEVATWMNRYFICIKVDREERPDVDQVYMSAVQLMTQQGGWPLNCFTLPDGKPIYGGTYFQKDNWIQILKSLEDTFRNRLDEVLDYAKKLTLGVQQSEMIVKVENQSEFEKSKLDELVLRWSHNFDSREGGSNRAPKFPLPNNYEFLLRYGSSKKNDKVLSHCLLTLEKMAFGGLFDQLGGGFCRYSVDVLWKVPHFEKMLYDNAQLVSLYSEAYKYSKNELYKEVVFKTLNWLANDMTDSSGAFYSALDADSEGVEGKFYVWTKTELEKECGDDYFWFKDYYNINQLGFWEDDNYILMRTEDDIKFAQKYGFELADFLVRKEKVRQKLLAVRKSRIAPGLDNKCLTSWNAMMLKGYCDAYEAFGEEEFLYSALKNAKWITKFQLNSDEKLFHSYCNGKSSIDGFLEDYAHVISAFIKLYEVTFDESWLKLAKDLLDYTLVEFFDNESGMFYFTSKNTELIARKMEINDNVLPASNSVMCFNLLKLGTLFQDEKYISISKQMLLNVYDGMEKYGSGYSNWAIALMNFTEGFKEIAITGPSWKENLKQVNQKYLPNTLFSGGIESSLPSFAGKEMNKDLFFICENNTCSIPQTDIIAFSDSLS